jgi:GT2 family glycosyltransferase
MVNVCVVILNWNNAPDSLACLQSLLESRPRPRTILVCDNGSSDGSAETIETWGATHFPVVPVTDREVTSWPGFVLIRNGRNLGFAAGNNPGIRHALGEPNHEYIWLLNNDSLVLPDTLAHLLRCADLHLNWGIIGSTLVDTPRSTTIRCAGGFRYNPWTSILHAAHGGASLANRLDLPAPRLDFIAGAALFVRARLLREVGLLNEEFFLYYEELDLCRRGCQAGWAIAWCRQAVVIHKGGASVARTGENEKAAQAFANYHENLSTLRFTRTHHRRMLPITGVLRFAGKLSVIVIRQQWHLFGPLLAAFRDFIRGKR